MKTNYVKYINAQVLNGYITEREAKFLKSNLKVNPNLRVDFERSAFKADITNNNNDFIKKGLIALMKHLNVIAIV